jgi:CDP-paratose 2-epimerase
VTGSSGLVGATLVEYLDAGGWATVGIDNNMRRELFGPGGDTSSRLQWLRGQTNHFVHHDLDVRAAPAVSGLIAETRPDLIVHCAAQPSH